MMISDVRVRPPTGTLHEDFGLLHHLAGTWIGTGFNLIWRPNFAPVNGIDSDHFLEINLTQEVLKFDRIGAPIPNRGLAQPDITLFGLHYLQQISDAVTFGALHIEPGIWVNVPASTQPNVPASVARLATIPHGNGLLAQGSAVSFPNPPVFKPANTIPFALAAPNKAVPFPESDLATPSNFRTNPLPPPDAISPTDLQAAVNDPNTMLAAAIQGQNITETVVINIATSPTIVVGGTTPPTQVVTASGGGGVENIAFLNSLVAGPDPSTAPKHTLPNAVAAEMFATFWIETVVNPLGQGTFFQLQYTQTVNLNFAGLTWPHVSVATLVRSNVVA